MRMIALATALFLSTVSGALAQTTTTTTTTDPNATASATPATDQATTTSTPMPSLTPLGQAIPVTGAPATTVAGPQAGAAGFIRTTDGLSVPVFGSDLFLGAYAGTRPGDRPDYRIQPGDQISVSLYGAINVSGVQAVDASGNVMVPAVGPVPVAGLAASQLQAAISTRVRSFYTGAVGVYASVVQAGSIGVFVTGDALRPGRYLGGASDNVLFFLAQAGGIDPARGSYRQVTVQRNGGPIATYDLYDFLLQGRIQPMRFQDGDIIFVAPRGPMVGVTGVARNAYAFEAPAGSRRFVGADLIPMARPEPTVNSVALRGFRGGQPQSAYYNLNDFNRVVLGDGDHVEFRSDAFAGNVTVKLQGELRSPSVIVLPRGSMLSHLLAKVPLDGTDVEPRFVHIQRAEVALEQKRALNEALYNLQKQVLTTAPLSADQAQLAQGQAALINDFVKQAQSIEPDGNIAVYTNGQFNDIRLRDGDTVILPNRTDVVIVTGEILNPGALAWANGASVKTYVGRAGGFAANANKRKVVIRHRDGSAEVASPGTNPGPGDEVVVLPKVGSQWLVLAKDLSQILFQIAVTAGTVIRLTESSNP